MYKTGQMALKSCFYYVLFWKKKNEQKTNTRANICFRPTMCFL